MRIDDDLLGEAAERVAGAFQYATTEGEKWEVFRGMLSDYARSRRERALELLTLSEMLTVLYPDLAQSSWAKFGWNDVLSGSMSPETFIKKLSVAKAAGSTTGKL